MGFSVSASTAIIFAGLFLAFGILFPAVSNGFDQVRDAQVDRDDAQVDLRNTQIEITDTAENEITVTNTGTTSLTVSEVDVIIDGDYQDRNNELVEGPTDGSDLWLPGEDITVDSSDADERVKIITEHGISVAEVI